ncbi:MAG: SAM-dependent methyltransferase [Bacteroidetes bacterium]|nr:SAM-dependent methyltransferase [Bacteroidota bacterium]
MENRQIILFFDKLTSVISNRRLVKLVLSSQRDRSSDLKSIIITIVEIKKGVRLNFVYRHKTNDITKNFDVEEAMAIVKKSLEEDFFNADLFSGEETLRLLITGNGKVKIRSNRTELKPVASFSHDRLKERIIATENNVYLKELGVLNSGFEVRNDMKDKYLQINNYIGLLAPFISELELPEGFHVADMGSGKGYLTFALYDYLTGTLGKTPLMTGVESKKDLVKLSNEIAKKASFTNLKFVHGTISEVALEKIDILIALHACDTATDDAIFRGIASGASLIVCAPCCHKQVRKAFHVTGALKPVTKHGILEERQAEIITDAIRALILEAHGYKTKVFEFISTEHTPKNVMIVGRKIPGKPAAMKKSLDQVRAIKELFGIEQHYLEGLCMGITNIE